MESVNSHLCMLSGVAFRDIDGSFERAICEILVSGGLWTLRAVAPENDEDAFCAAICLEKPKEKNFGKRRTHARSKAPESFTQQARNIATPTSELRRESSVKPTRYVSRETKHLVWNRDQGRCQNCQGQRNLNIDHILPFALSGNSHPSNLRLLCFHCNQRQAIKAFPQSTFPS